MHELLSPISLRSQLSIAYRDDAVMTSFADEWVGLEQGRDHAAEVEALAGLDTRRPAEASTSRTTLRLRPNTFQIRRRTEPPRRQERQDLMDSEFG